MSILIEVSVLIVLFMSFGITYGITLGRYVAGPKHWSSGH